MFDMGVILVLLVFDASAQSIWLKAIGSFRYGQYWFADAKGMWNFHKYKMSFKWMLAIKKEKLLPTLENHDARLKQKKKGKKELFRARDSHAHNRWRNHSIQ